MPLTSDHFHVMMYAKGVRMYDIKCDRNRAIDFSTGYVASIYGDWDDVEATHRFLALELSKEPDEELNYALIATDAPLNCVITHCDGDCSPHHCLN